MTDVAVFTFNAFQENTYVVFDETKQCIIVDPGCDTEEEERELAEFITKNNLVPVRLVNTHCHIDHILGNAFVHNTWGVELEFHEKEQRVLDEAPNLASFFGVRCNPQPPLGKYISEGEVIEFGNSTLISLFTPGHSPGSLSLYCESSGFILSGDVLFKDGIGRYDLPGASLTELKKSILQKLVPLPSNTRVLSGHGEETTIGREIKKNPYLIEFTAE